MQEGGYKYTRLARAMSHVSMIVISSSDRRYARRGDPVIHSKLNVGNAGTECAALSPRARGRMCGERERVAFSCFIS